MLVISRRTGQGICIPFTEKVIREILLRISEGESVSIQLQIAEIRNNSVRLGIEAPKEIPIHRDELLQPKDAA